LGEHMMEKELSYSKSRNKIMNQAERKKIE
jgi:hypothetical protein